MRSLSLLKMYAIAALFAVVVPLQALAQETVQLVDPGMNETTKIIVAIIAVALPILLKFFSDWRGGKAARELELIHAAARSAFFMTEEAKRLFPTKVKELGTVAYALEAFNKALAAYGVPPTEKTKAIATTLFSSMHGETKVQEDLAVAAAPSP